MSFIWISGGKLIDRGILIEPYFWGVAPMILCARLELRIIDLRGKTT